jgi:putative hydrolase of the HAD superfamily
LKVKAVVFDLGKVLVDFDYGIAARELARQSKISVEKIRKVIDQSPLLFRYESAQMTTQEFFEEVCRQIGYHGTFEEFTASFADIFTEIPKMIALHRELRAARFPIFVLSNTNEIAVSHIRRNFPFFKKFSGYILSYEQGVLKPKDRIYQITEKITGCRNGEILFLDDKIENIGSACRRGWRTVLHRSPEESIGAVRKWLADELA